MKSIAEEITRIGAKAIFLSEGHFFNKDAKKFILREIGWWHETDPNHWKRNTDNKSEIFGMIINVYPCIINSELYFLIDYCGRPRY